ncbi:hypothetical protein [Enterococcus sp. DIV0876]|uniref:hypothetical protein n=1 Tax=Enterococcus sp. DIV0876 TaxID=2774633 RepID=UPI003D2FCAE8
MKNTFIVLLSFTFLFLTSCTHNSVEESIGESDYYSKKEIKEAMDTVISTARKELSVADIVSLTYDSADCNRVIETIMPTLEVDKTYSQSDALVINSEIKTKYSSGSLEPLSNYSNYYWILIKDDTWKIIYSGFLN